MRSESYVRLTPRMEAAVHELQGLITARFPQAAFVVEEGCDPQGLYLVTTVDIADTGEVTAVVGDRLVALQVDEGLPGSVPLPAAADRSQRRAPAGAGGGHATGASPAPMRERHIDKDPY